MIIHEDPQDPSDCAYDGYAMDLLRRIHNSGAPLTYEDIGALVTDYISAKDRDNWGLTSIEMTYQNVTEYKESS